VVVATAQRHGELLITKLALEGPALRARAEIYGRGECASKHGRMGTLKSFSALEQLCEPVSQQNYPDSVRDERNAHADLRQHSTHAALHSRLLRQHQCV
jgi:hypothetical protein